MLVYLEPWIEVQDGQIPELGAGDVLRGVGVVAACWSIGSSQAVDVCEAAAGPDPDGFNTAQVILDGVVAWRDGARAGVVDVGGTLFLVRGMLELVGPEQWRRKPVELPAVGNRTRLHAALAVMAEHEHPDAAEELPDSDHRQPTVRRDWLVEAVYVEPRAAFGHSCGDVVGVDTLDRMDCWEDEDRGGEYLLDLTPMAPMTR